MGGDPSPKPPGGGVTVKFLRMRCGAGYGRSKSDAKAPVVIWKSS